VLFRHSREPQTPGQNLATRMTLFVVGAALGLAGIAVDNRILVYAGIAVLFFGVLLRFKRDDA
jgi:hypothetical protein